MTNHRRKLAIAVLLLTVLAANAHARKWADKTGTYSIEADIVSTSGDNVRLKKLDGTYIDVPIAQLCDADKKVVESFRSVPSPDPFHNAVTSPGESSPPKSMQTVLAEGVGLTRQEALKDAFRNAVRQVVGAVLDSETLVKDDQVIEDKVLTNSDGIIGSGYEELSEKTEGGLVRVKIKASVQRGTVVARLRAASVIVKAFDGKALFAEAVTKLEAQGSALEILSQAFTVFPSGVFDADIKSKPSIAKGTDGKVLMTYQLTVKGDFAKYDQWQKKAVPLLDQLAANKGEKFIVARRQSEDNSHEGLSLEYMFPDGREREAWGKILRDPKVRLAIEQPFMKLGENNDDVFTTPRHKPEKCKTICINTSRNATSDRTTWKWYDLPIEWKIFRPVIEVSLLDSEGAEITRDVVEFGDEVMPGITCDTWTENNLIVSPGIFKSSYNCYAPMITFPRTIELQPEELERVSTTKCVIRQGAEISLE